MVVGRLVPSRFEHNVGFFCGIVRMEGHSVEKEVTRTLVNESDSLSVNDQEHEAGQLLPFEAATSELRNRRGTERRTAPSASYVHRSRRYSSLTLSLRRAYIFLFSKNSHLPNGHAIFQVYP